jgi:hypothetical protein
MSVFPYKNLNKKIRRNTFLNSLKLETIHVSRSSMVDNDSNIYSHSEICYNRSEQRRAMSDNNKP